MAFVGLLKFPVIRFAKSCGRCGVGRIFFERPTKQGNGIVDILGNDVVIKVAAALDIEIVGGRFGGAMSG